MQCRWESSTLFQQILPAAGRDMATSFVTNHTRLPPLNGYSQRVELPLHINTHMLLERPMEEVRVIKVFLQANILFAHI